MKIPIERWDSVILEKNPRPMIYISSEFSDIIPNGKFSFLITETSGCYDEIVVEGQLHKTSLMGGFLPNFSNQTRFLTILPENMAWQGYPKNNGSILINDNDNGSNDNGSILINDNDNGSNDNVNRVEEYTNTVAVKKQKPRVRKVMNYTFICIILIVLILNNLNK